MHLLKRSGRLVEVLVGLLYLADNRFDADHIDILGQIAQISVRVVNGQSRAHPLQRMIDRILHVRQVDPRLAAANFAEEGRLGKKEVGHLPPVSFTLRYRTARLSHSFFTGELDGCFASSRMKMKR